MTLFMLTELMISDEATINGINLLHKSETKFLNKI
jgi:hypothetical protein